MQQGRTRRTGFMGRPSQASFSPHHSSPFSAWTVLRRRNTGPSNGRHHIPLRPAHGETPRQAVQLLLLYEFDDWPVPMQTV